MTGKRKPKDVECRECGKITQAKKIHHLGNVCKECAGVIRRAAWHEKYKALDEPQQRNRWLKKKYGLTIEDYDELLEQQDGQCKICQRPPEDATNGRLYVDHHHESGRIRGLLCQKCNSALAFFEDDIQILEAAIDYLRSS